MVDGSCWGGGAPFTLHRRAMAAAERKKDSVPEAQKVGPERGAGRGPRQSAEAKHVPQALPGAWWWCFQTVY